MILKRASCKPSHSNQKYPEACFNLGNLYVELGRNLAAETNFLRAISLKPDYVNAYINLANVQNFLVASKKLRKITPMQSLSTGNVQ